LLQQNAFEERREGHDRVDERSDLRSGGARVGPSEEELPERRRRSHRQENRPQRSRGRPPGPEQGQRRHGGRDDAEVEDDPRRGLGHGEAAHAHLGKGGQERGSDGDQGDRIEEPHARLQDQGDADEAEAQAAP
jgi:hypothetical protein